MTTRFSSFGVQSHEPGFKQVAAHLRECIRRGELAAGAKLPSIEEMANRFHTTASTVYRALTPLVKEGFLERRHGLGTFVRRREAKLTCVGIYYAEDIWTKSSSDFQRAVHAAIKAELNPQGIETQTWIDPRPLATQATPWPKLQQAAENREIQGLISVLGGRRHLGWQNKLPIPSAHFGAAIMPNQVINDARQLAEISLHAVAEQGCRSVGLINQRATNETSLVTEFYEHFTDLASDLRLRVKNEWMRVPDSRPPAPATGQAEQFGYEEFHKLWGQSDRPEGLIVPNDVNARGVILAIREQQVRVPEELKLVVHKNETVDLFCPMPATFAVFSEQVCAAALIAQIQKQFRGERCEPISLPFRLVAHRADPRSPTTKPQPKGRKQP